MALVLLSAATSCLAQVTPPPVEKTPLELLDDLFVPAYNNRAAAINATNPPYVEVFGSSLFLHLHGQPAVRAIVLTAPYHHLKDVAHAPFTIYLSLVGLGSAQLSDAQLTPLREISARLVAAENVVSSSEFDLSQEKRQHAILDASTSLVNKVLTNKAVDQDELKEFARAMAPLMLANADEAGCLQVQVTHQRIMQWKSQMTESEWRNLRVVIKNSHQARYRNADTQYFSWLLQGSAPTWALPGENSRVVYAEALGKGQSAGDELVAVLVDFDASRAFFGDDWRMTEDILSQGAARCIAQLSPSDRGWSTDPSPAASPVPSPVTTGAK